MTANEAQIAQDLIECGYTVEILTGSMQKIESRMQWDGSDEDEKLQARWDSAKRNRDILMEVAA